MIYLFNQPESESLISFIEDKVDFTIGNKSGWTLYIMTCYITINGLDNLFVSLANSFEQNKLVKVKILVDKDEWAKLFFFNKERVLKDRIKKLKNINKNVDINTSDISVKPVNSDKLFHAKSFALINENFEGFIISTSANLTERGLNKNLEFGDFVQNSTDLNQQYVNLFSEIEEKALGGNEKILRDIAEAELILSMGVFYTKINTLDTACSVDKSQNAINEDQTFRKKSLSDNKQSISYRLVDHIAIKKILPPLVPSQLITHYSIETLIGRWIPHQINQLMIEERTNEYLNAYIDFMTDRYFNPISIENEKEALKISIENHIKKEEINTYDKKSRFASLFIDECVIKMEKAGFINNSRDYNDSILGIFFDYRKLEEIEFEDVPNNLKKAILKEIKNSIKRKKLNGYKLKELILYTTKDDHLDSESFKTKLDEIAKSFKNEEEDRGAIENSIKNLREGDIFSALISYKKDNKNYTIISGCIFDSHFYVNLDEKMRKRNLSLKAINYHFDDSEHYIRTLSLDQITLFNKFDDNDKNKSEKDKIFFLPLLYLKQQFQKLSKKFDEDISKIVLRELDYAPIQT
jgi:hypothetical protein